MDPCQAAPSQFQSAKITHLLIPVNTLGEILLLQSRGISCCLRGKGRATDRSSCTAEGAKPVSCSASRKSLWTPRKCLQCPVPKSKGALCEDPLAAGGSHHPQHPAGAQAAHLHSLLAFQREKSLPRDTTGLRSTACSQNKYLCSLQRNFSERFSSCLLS